jgi:hypothetical protein
MRLADEGGRPASCRLQRTVERILTLTSLLRCAFAAPMLEEPPADLVFLIARTPQTDLTAS